MNCINNQGNCLLPKGTILQMGKYRIDRELASGGFGNTYVITNLYFDEQFALKEFFIKGISERDKDSTTVSVSNLTNVNQFEGQKEKFKKEARRLRKLNNTHIVGVHDLFEENGTAYYVMDLIDGESLSARLKRTGKPLSEQETLNILDQVLDALDEVHNMGIWHLDLKPGNILIDKQGNAKLIDFGASKQLSSSDGSPTTTSSMCYTTGYAPTEQLDQNIERIGAWTDLYALGATLYNLLTANKPPTISDIQDGEAFNFPTIVSDKMRKLIEWMMTPQRTKRPQSVAEVRQYIQDSQSSYVSEDDEITRIVKEPEIDATKLFNDDVGEPNKLTKEKTPYLKWAIVSIVVAVLALSIFILVSKSNNGYHAIGERDSNKIEYKTEVNDETVSIEDLKAVVESAKKDGANWTEAQWKDAFKTVMKAAKPMLVAMKDMEKKAESASEDEKLKIASEMMDKIKEYKDVGDQFKAFNNVADASAIGKKVREDKEFQKEIEKDLGFGEGFFDDI